MLAYRYLLPAFLFLVSTPACHAVLFVDGFTASVNDRFANSSDFFAEQFDLTGVGRADAGWVTLIQDPSGGNPYHFVSAHHARPSGSVSFLAGNDPSSTPIVCQVSAEGSRIGASDIWIGKLDPMSCDTSTLTGYEIATDNNVGHFGSLALQAGISNTTYQPGVRTTNMRFGQNQVNSFRKNATFISRTGDWVIYDDDSTAGDLLNNTATPGLVDHETAFFGGDSGGPSFLMVGSSLQLLGVHSFRGEYVTNDADGDGQDDLNPDGTVIETPTQRLSGDAYLPSSRTEILAAVRVTAVPEPSPFLLLACLSACCIVRAKLPGCSGRRKTPNPV